MPLGFVLGSKIQVDGQELGLWGQRRRIGKAGHVTKNMVDDEAW